MRGLRLVGIEVELAWLGPSVILLVRAAAGDEEREERRSHSRFDIRVVDGA